MTGKTNTLKSAEITPDEPIGMVQQAEPDKPAKSKPIPDPVDDLSNANVNPKHPIGMVQQAERKQQSE